MENQTASSEREQVEFYLSCRNLKNMDRLSKSDPQVRLYFKNAKDSWIFVKETEIIQNSLNPDFQKTFLVDFIFETHQHIKFEVVDSDGSNSYEIIGSVETTVGDIMGARKQTFISDIKHKEKATGKLIVRGEKVDEGSQSISWQWSGIKLMNTDGWFGKSDPFLKFFKKKVDGEYLLVHTTEVIRNNLNPVWRAFSISDKKLCVDSYLDNFKVECWDREGSGKHQFIGEFETSLEKMKSGVLEYALHNPKKRKDTGHLKVSNFSIAPRMTFVDYLRGGTQLNVVVAIDFTASNGSPKSASSLHYKSMDPPNQYYQAISAVCPIVLKYDSDQLIPLYGFGGVMPWTYGPSHCFPLTGGGEASEEVQGVEGILDTYSKSLDLVDLSAPTNFATVIETVNAKCRQIKETESDQYMVLLILTDGEISDMEETTRAIIKAAELPLSIIIVGVGSAGFDNMEALDGDKAELKSKKEKAARDLVQFVPFRDFKDDPELLAKQVLAEVPEQLLKYMELVGRKPLIAQVFDMNQINTTLPVKESGGLSDKCE